MLIILNRVSKEVSRHIIYYIKITNNFPIKDIDRCNIVSILRASLNKQLKKSNDTRICMEICCTCRTAAGVSAGVSKKLATDPTSQHPHLILISGHYILNRSRIIPYT
jgi:hypothetical protein